MAVESHRCDAKVADSHPVMTTSSLFLRSSLGMTRHISHAHVHVQGGFC